MMRIVDDFEESAGWREDDAFDAITAEELHAARDDDPGYCFVTPRRRVAGGWSA